MGALLETIYLTTFGLLEIMWPFLKIITLKYVEHSRVLIDLTCRRVLDKNKEIKIKNINAFEYCTGIIVAYSCIVIGLT